jgi:hypothetical protein
MARNRKIDNTTDAILSELSKFPLPGIGNEMERESENLQFRKEGMKKEGGFEMCRSWLLIVIQDEERDDASCLVLLLFFRLPLLCNSLILFQFGSPFPLFLSSV